MWSQFVDFVNKRFGPPLRSNPLGELSRLTWSGSVADYQDQFLLLLSRCENVTEPQQIDLFTAGLLNPLQVDVEMQRPTTLEDAMSLARAFERRLKVEDGAATTVASSPVRPPPSTRLPARSSPRTPPPGSAPSASSSTPPAPHKPAPGTRFSRLTPAEMAECRVQVLQLSGEILQGTCQDLHHEGYLPP